MALAAALEAWRESLRTLLAGLGALRLALEDSPEAHVLSDLFGAPLDDLCSTVAEALARSGELGTPAPRLTTLMRFVTEASGDHHRAQRAFLLDVAPLERVAELAGAAQERAQDYGGAWQEWAAGVVSDLGRCQRLLLEASGALQRLLQEVSERVEAAPALVQATNIGQQISLPPDASARGPFAAPPFAEAERVT